MTRLRKKMPRLVIMAKAPIIGRAKTRLAAGIGPVHAKRVYIAMLSRLLSSVTSPKWDTVLAVDPPQSLGREPLWSGFLAYGQVSGSLTPRLYQALNYDGPVVVIGTDCPQLSASQINAAFQALRQNDAVFGPANDGGFYLMGIKGPARRGLFDNVRWSGSETLSDVLENFTRLYPGGKYFTLPVLSDIDTAEDLKRYKSGPTIH